MKKKLLFSLTKKDFRIDTFKSGGKGGQHQNKTDSGVRITHIETGISAESRSFKSQHRNKQEALKRLIKNKTFWLWINKKAGEITSNETIEERVNKMMNEKNLKVEFKDDCGRWKEVI